MSERARALAPPFDGTVGGLLQAAAKAEPDRVILVAGERSVTLADLARAAQDVAADLAARGIRPGDPVVTMLGNGPRHVALFLGLSLAGALWVPLDPAARGPSLAHALATTKPVLAFCTVAAAERVEAVAWKSDRFVVEADAWPLSSLRAKRSNPDERDPSGTDADWIASASPRNDALPDDVRAILFTSGTTGPPKGVQVTERMLLASAAGCARACDGRDGDVFLMWEPMHHIGGPQLLVMALILRVKLVVIDRFSASGLWPTVRRHEVTKLHYLGGILDILLKAPPAPDDRDHPVKLAFGGGCRRETWRAFEQRFGIPIREVYGMTEASSFTTVNMDGILGSVGTPVPWFDVAIRDESGAEVPDGTLGEITATCRHPGLFTPGYLNAPEATAKLLRDGRLRSGDLGKREADGHFRFVGRVTDSLRRRGENISAWEVETALAAHPDIAECAVIGVPAQIGEHDILCFVSLRDGARFDPPSLAAWCLTVMPPHHVPRWWKRVDAFERTPSLRIRKDRLDRSLEDATDTAPARDRQPH